MAKLLVRLRVARYGAIGSGSNLRPETLRDSSLIKSFQREDYHIFKVKKIKVYCLKKSMARAILTT